MRRLLWFTLGFAGVTVGCSVCLWNRTLLLPGLVCLLLGLAVHWLAWERMPFLKAAAVLLGMSAGLLWFFGLQKTVLHPLEILDGETVTVTLEAIDYSEDSLYGGSVLCRWKGRKVLVYLKEYQELPPGAHLTGEFRFRLTTPEGLKESRYYQGRGIFLLASQRGSMAVFEGNTGRLRYFPARLGHRVQSILEAVFPADTLSFAKALLLGDTDGLDYETNTAFQVSGIRHIIAVSGLHVGILYGILMLLTGKNPILSIVLGLPMLLVFAAAAGFTPSVSRAALMTGVMLLARLFKREYDPLSELSFAALVLVVYNPFVVVSVSFQLSMASVLGILLFQPRLYRDFCRRLHCETGWKWTLRLRRYLAASLAVTLSAQIFTLPLTAYYFGAVSLVSALTNLLVLPVVGAAFTGILVSVALGAIWLPAGGVGAAAVSWLLRYIAAVARVLSKIPMAAVYLRSTPLVVWTAVSWLLVLLVLWRRKWLRLAVPVWAGGLAVAMVLTALPPRQDSIRLTVLDVGQGQGLLLQSKGKTFLVDCGGSSGETAADAAAETLLSQSIYRMDALLLTHLDEDHIGGVEGFLSRIGVDTLYLPLEDTEGRGRALADSFSGQVVWVSDTQTVTLGAASVHILQSKQGKTKNENSLGVLFETENCGILITGDRNLAGEKALVSDGLIKDIDVLVAGHHGSKNATGDLLLDTAKPETVIISVGAGNSYGHPAAEMLERVNRRGCTVLRTDTLGTIVYRG